jgi:hypothetical protein
MTLSRNLLSNARESNLADIHLMCVTGKKIQYRQLQCGGCYPAFALLARSDTCPSGLMKSFRCATA